MTENRDQRASLQGTITKITYQNPEGRYTVARLEVDRSQVTIVGEIYPVREGEEIRVSGTWSMHPRYGLQFRAEHWEKIEPATLQGIERYLGSGLIKGIGPTYARRLVSAFGLDTLKVLSEEPHKVLSVPGIGEIRAKRILEAWGEQKGMRDIMVFLQGHGVSSSLALKIYRAFGPETVMRVKENPYALAKEVHGIGFVIADRIAGSLGVSQDSPLRVQAGLVHLLGQFSEGGHCFVPLALLKAKACSILGVSEESAQRALERLAATGEVILEEPGGKTAVRVYPRELHRAETRVASAIRDLLSAPSCLIEKGKEAFKRVTLNLFSPAALVLSEEQCRAVLQALHQKVLVITGGPGTGKTTLLTSLLALLRSSEVSFSLAAPTGRAAKRMGEMAGEEAKTIHRLLEYNPRDRTFQRTENNPLDASVVIIDEASMVDLPLMDNLLSALNPRSHLVLVGDVDQLPPVGPGSVLKDLIDSGTVPVVVLHQIFRQAEESPIIVNAQRILRGQPLLLSQEAEKKGFAFIPRENEEEILETVKTLVKEGFRDAQGSRLWMRQLSTEIQLLTPMHRGLLGTAHLNRELQGLLNPHGEPVEPGGTLFRLGDQVMQLRNNYDKGVFNGDLGRIVQIDKQGEELKVDFYGRSVSYGFEELSEITLAYAISIHKSQGTEYRGVVIPLHTSHYLMLHRSLLYTAVTRGKELVIVVGSRRALAMAIKNVRVEQRWTSLKERLARPQDQLRGPQ